MALATPGTKDAGLYQEYSKRRSSDIHRITNMQGDPPRNNKKLSKISIIPQNVFLIFPAVVQ